MNPSDTPSPCSRRSFLRHQLPALGGGLVATLAVEYPKAAPNFATPQARQSRIKLGVIGTGGRGAWIANLFKEHGGYEIWAVADYFQEVADACGDHLGVHSSRRFSTLSGYRQVLESGVDAVALETPPCFFPEHATAAVDAGLHVYMAKPVAVDVPGCRDIEAAAAKATANQRTFFVDYQIPTDPHNQEVMRRVQAGELGPIAVVNSHYFAGPFPDPAFTSSYADRLRSLIWCNDVAGGGGYHVNACIHAVDAALWVTGSLPVAAMATSRRLRPNPNGDSHDVFSILFEFADGLTVSHRGEHLDNRSDFNVVCQIQCQSGYAETCYGGKASCRSHDDGYTGQVDNLYEAGARRNIAAFHEALRSERCDNSTVRRSLDGALATILGREAGRRRTRLTMQELLAENRRLELHLPGLRS